jgi:hypothetical protein
MRLLKLTAKILLCPGWLRRHPGCHLYFARRVTFLYCADIHKASYAPKFSGSRLRHLFLFAAVAWPFPRLRAASADRGGLDPVRRRQYHDVWWLPRIHAKLLDLGSARVSRAEA